MATGPELLQLIQGGGGGAGGAGGGGDAAIIYFASTHGVYPINEGILPTFVVPENTYIFEASSIGEATLTTIDAPLWELIQNRKEFANYISGDPSATDGLKKIVIQNLVYYKPGDRVYHRRLILEAENRFEYNWGYFKFQQGEPPVPFPQGLDGEGGAYLQHLDKPLVLPENVPNPPATPNMATFRNEHYPPGTERLRKPPRVETCSNEYFINETRKREQYAGPAIFIFSSCASYWESDTEEGKRIDKAQIIDIGRTQQTAKLNFLEMFPGGRYERRGESVPKPKLRTSGRPKFATEGFIKELKANPQYIITQLDELELKYLEKVGEENPRYVPPRYPHLRVPQGAASIFVRTGEKRAGEFFYQVERSPTAKTWWTPEEINKAVTEGRQLYVNVGGEFHLLQRQAGVYTAALRQAPAPTPPGHSTRGGRRKSRRVKRNSKRSNKKKTRRTL
jgi:hypothetical protein